jgi:hypothetical protein
METATASSSYIDTIVSNLHIQADTMMEEIHLGTSGLAAALTAFYSNKMLSAPLSAPHPPGKNNGSGPVNGNGSNNNRHRNNNRRNGGSGGKNSDNGGNYSGNTARNTTMVSHVATTNDGQGPPPWPTSLAMVDVCGSVAGAHRHVPWPIPHRPATVAGFHGHDRALHPTGLCP